MLYRRLADVVVIIHWVTGGFFLLGGFMARETPWLALLHIPLALWVCAAFSRGWTCPLTPLENWLRKAAGEQGYEGNFIDHYLGGFTGTPSRDGELPSESGWKNKILGTIFCVVALVPYADLFRQDVEDIRPVPDTPAATPGAVPDRSESLSRGRMIGTLAGGSTPSP